MLQAPEIRTIPLPPARESFATEVPILATDLSPIDFTPLESFAAPGGVGAVVATLVKGHDRWDIATGLAGPAKTPTQRTLFGIGSITKGFTGLLLARLVLDGRLGLEDPLSGFWPDLQGRPAGEISVEQLATHTSGLPRRPPSSDGNPPTDLYRGLTRGTVLDELAGVEVVGGPYEYAYSNFGMAVLGQVLEIAGRATYENLLRELVLLPAALSDMCFESETASGEAATPLGKSGNTVPRQWNAGLIGAGGLVGNGDTMATLIHALIDPGSVPVLADAIVLATTARARQPSSDGNPRHVGLGWQLLGWAPLGTVVWHNGHGRGGHTFIAVAPEHHAGIAVLTNHHHPPALDLSALRILRNAVAA